MQTPLPEDVVLDDSILLQDRLVRSLHRNNDGHLAGSHRGHETDRDHNVAVLYVYTRDPDGLYTLHEHYAYSEKSLNYKEWCKYAHEEARKIAQQYSKKDLHGVYGWNTAFIQITPLRTGDLFIKIDEKGAHGVRLSFGSRTSKRQTRKG